MVSSLKRILEIVGGISALLGLILIYNVWFWLSEGNPTIPQLEGGWWAGYYETSLFGKQWCVARFVKDPTGQLKMVLLSPTGAPDTFDVERSSSSQTFVYFTFTEPAHRIQVEAKQLYAGERYYLGRLIAGRFSDFWKLNEDVAIRGHFVPTSPELEFGIEPISEDKLENFWSRYVRPHQPTPLPTEIMADIGMFK
jgi:hypothetical protein